MSVIDNDGFEASFEQICSSASFETSRGAPSLCYSVPGHVNFVERLLTVGRLTAATQNVA